MRFILEAIILDSLPFTKIKVKIMFTTFQNTDADNEIEHLLKSPLDYVHYTSGTHFARATCDAFTCVIIIRCY